MRNFILLGLDGACPDIIERATEDGLLPNFHRLRDVGCYADNIPFPSAVTPGNWAAIATGSKPITNGISDFCMHTPGLPLDERHDVFTKDRCRAEFLWDAYSRRGHRAATISFPGSLPQTEPNHLAIGSSGHAGENLPPHTIAPHRAIVAGSPNPVGPYDWREYERVTLTPVKDDPGVAGFHPKWMLDFNAEASRPGYAGNHPLRLYLGERGGQEIGVICDGEQRYAIAPREWSPLIERSFDRDVSVLRRWITAPLGGSAVVGEFRVRIVQLDLEAGDLILYLSPIYPKHDFSSDPAQTLALRDQLGHYDDTLPMSRLITGCLDEQGWYDAFREQGIWQARAALSLVHDLGYRAVCSKWHAFDKFYHFLMGNVDASSPSFSADEFERYEDLHISLLQIADEMVGIALDGLGDDTDLVVISDHGLMASRRSVWVNRYLAQQGYIHFDKAADGEVVVDWRRTRAYVSSFMLLNTNLKGRDPEGIVEPGEEYEQLKAELIELLRGWRDPATGAHVMTDVFDPAKDGAYYGLGSELDGDIRYFTAPGYTLYRSIAVDGEETITDVIGPWHGDHGSCRPTTRYGRGSEVGIFYAAGKAIKRMGKRSKPVFPCDIVPTLLHISGEAPLQQQEGAVLHDILKSPHPL